MDNNAVMWKVPKSLFRTIPSIITSDVACTGFYIIKSQ